MKHTQGNWNIEENTNHYPFVMADDNNTIAMLFNEDGSLLYGRTFEETKANAKLIAAAPELLEALVRLTFWSKQLQKQLLQYEFPQESGPGNEISSKIEKAETAIKKATE